MEHYNTPFQTLFAWVLKRPPSTPLPNASVNKRTAPQDLPWSTQPSSQGYGFSSGHVSMWELDYKESWAPRNWCFWTMVLEKTRESPLDYKEIQPVHPKGDQSWCSLGGLTLKLKLQCFGHLMRRADSSEKTLMLGEIEGRRRRGWQRMRMVGWHHQLDGHGFGWTPGVGDGQGGLVCCSSWGHKEPDTTEWLNWTELNQNNQGISALLKFLVGNQIWKRHMHPNVHRSTVCHSQDMEAT